jgi:hypothetical protein
LTVWAIVLTGLECDDAGAADVSFRVKAVLRVAVPEVEFGVVTVEEWRVAASRAGVRPFGVASSQGLAEHSGRMRRGRRGSGLES